MISTKKAIKGKGCFPIQREKENEDQRSVDDYKESCLLKGEGGERDREKERKVGRLVSRKELYLNFKEEGRKEGMEGVRNWKKK